MHTISNNFLEVKINREGAELKSVVDRHTGYEFMWQADPPVWPRTAPVLFPFVGKCVADHFEYAQQLWPITQHGFARDMAFDVAMQRADEIVFTLRDSPETLAKYPFPFVLELGYRLSGNALECSYRVTNTGEVDMFFSIGAHPGFRLVSGVMSDYVLDFGTHEPLQRCLLENGLLSGRTSRVEAQDGLLPLHPSLFEQDAIVLKHLQTEKVSLRSKRSGFCVSMAWKDFPYLGIWSKKGNEDFLCIEPWCGIAGTVGGPETLSEKEGINRLAPSAVFERSYSIKFTSE